MFMKENKKKFDIFIWLILFILCLITPGLTADATAAESQGVNITSTTLMYALDQVNVRDNPSTDGEILGELQAGDTIFAMELTEEGWYRVAYGDEKGYIRQDFLAVYGMEGDWQTPGLEELEESLEAEAALYEEEPATDTETEEESVEAQEEAPKKEKKNIAPIIIIILVLVVIIAYSAVQILRERKQVGENEDGEEDLEELEDEEPDGEELEDERLINGNGELEDASLDVEAPEMYAEDLRENEENGSDDDDSSLKDDVDLEPGEEIDFMELAWDVGEKSEKKAGRKTPQKARKKAGENKS